MKKTVFIFAAIMGLFVSMTACANKKANDMNAKANGPAQENGKTLVAYASYTGTTEGVAKMIATATGGELYKIEPEKEYTAAVDDIMKLCPKDVSKGEVYFMLNATR